MRFNVIIGIFLLVLAAHVKDDAPLFLMWILAGLGVAFCVAHDVIAYFKRHGI